MLIFPVWLVQFLVIGGLALCGAGAVALIVFLIVDKRSKQVW
ncbi:hypothetical protein [Stieleria tagensis]|nr:hypothetical protein [Stieleria tagensis]